MKNKQVAKDYMARFIEARKANGKKGVSVVIEETGLNKQTVWQLSTGRNAPNQATIDRFAEVYGRDFDVTLASGIEPAPPTGLVIEDGIDWKEKYFELESRFTSLESLYNTLTVEFKGLMGEYKDLLKQMVKEGVKMSFNSAGSHPTAHVCFSYTPAGFDYPGRPATDAKVLDHPAKMALGGKVIPMPVKGNQLQTA